ncbi:MAG: hypothetical protein LBT31_01005 [Synergistaceae bacterium]|nr:hypothetical protein [Synergistaceae bacterium]
MKESIVKTGISSKKADGIAQRFMFIGAVMIRNSQHISIADDDAFLAQSEKTGRALGKALGCAYNIYGEKKLQDAATVMMHSVRAGVLAETASETFTSLAANGYAFDAVVSLLHDASEFVRSSLLPDNGVALCSQIRRMADHKAPIQHLASEIKLASDRENLRQTNLLAQKEANRNKRESARSSGGGGTTARRNGSNGSGGASASATGGRASGGDSSGGGGDSSGGSNGDGSGSGGDSGSSNSGSGGDSGSGGSSSSGGDSGSEGNSGSGGSGGSSSSGGDSASGGSSSSGGDSASGGNSSSGGDSASGSDGTQ